MHLVLPGNGGADMVARRRSMDKGGSEMYYLRASSGVCSSRQELRMTLEMLNARFRGVLCSHCGKPVRLPEIILGKEKILRESELNSILELSSRVFVLRCRACVREAMYGMNQIVECELPLVSPMPSLKANAASGS